MKSFPEKLISLITVSLVTGMLAACGSGDATDIFSGSSSGSSYSCSVSQAKANAITTGMNLAQVRNVIGCDGRLHSSQGQLTSWYFQETPTKMIVVLFIDGAVNIVGYYQ